jgi:hypothetical protein
VAPLTATVLAAAPDEHAGIASGINNAVARAAGLLAIAILGAIAITIFAKRLDARLATQNVPAEVRRAMHEQRVKLVEATPPAGPHALLVREAVRQSFVDAFRVNALISASLAALSALGAIGVRKRV